MNPPHTPESLLALTKSPEGLEELRIIAAEAEGWELVKEDNFFKSPDLWIKDNVWYQFDAAPNYPTSLDAIFAAEERLGLHDGRFNGVWTDFCEHLFELLDKPDRAANFAFLSPPLRLIPFILTAQWKEQNQ